MRGQKLHVLQHAALLWTQTAVGKGQHDLHGLLKDLLPKHSRFQQGFGHKKDGFPPFKDYQGMYNRGNSSMSIEGLFDDLAPCLAKWRY